MQVAVKSKYLDSNTFKAVYRDDQKTAESTHLLHVVFLLFIKSWWKIVSILFISSFDYFVCTPLSLRLTKKKIPEESLRVLDNRFAPGALSIKRAAGSPGMPTPLNNELKYRVLSPCRFFSVFNVPSPRAQRLGGWNGHKRPVLFDATMCIYCSCNKSRHPVAEQRYCG